MDILVIKQTSLGDVLHASGHVRAIKQQFPHSRLVLLTANTSQDIFRFSPWVDETILVDRYGVKANWYRKPVWAFREMYRVMKAVRRYEFDLAFDLQGLAKSVVFLYGARAKKKFVKGRWLGIQGYRNKHDHALDEMDKVLGLAGVSTTDTRMELHGGPDAARRVDQLLADTESVRAPRILLSPFSRWPSKDWPLDNYLDLARELEDRMEGALTVYLTGTPGDGEKIETALTTKALSQTNNLAGRLSMLEFFELLSRADLLVTGDSFPMHAAVAAHTPVLAMFGPTHESRVGPRGASHTVLRAPECRICDRKNCPEKCLARISVSEVADRVVNLVAKPVA